MADGLTVLDVGLVAGSAAQHHDGEHQLHVLLQLRVDKSFISHGVICQMNGHGRSLVDAANQIAVNAFRHKGNHGGCRLGGGHQSRVEGHIGIDLILFHAFAPEAAAAAAHIPVGKLIHKGLQSLGGLGHAIVAQAVVHLFHHGVQT